MERRRGEREREIESDTRDRQKEREELDDLKSKIFAEGHSDPSATFKQVRAIHLFVILDDNQYLHCKQLIHLVKLNIMNVNRSKC